MQAEAYNLPERPLGPIRPVNPGRNEPPPKEWVGDVQVVDDEPDRPRRWSTGPGKE